MPLENEFYKINALEKFSDYVMVYTERNLSDHPKTEPYHGNSGKEVKP